MRYRALTLLCLLSMITYIDRVCFGVAGPSIVSALGLRDVSDLKGAFTAFAIAYSLFEVPSGWLGDRWGARVTLTRIVLWWSTFTIVTGMIGWSWQGMVIGGAGTLIVIRFLFGAGEAGAYPNITRALHDWFPPHQWPGVQGMVWMSGRLAGGLTPLVWMFLVAGPGSILSWRSVFFLFGGIGFVWCLFFWVFFRDRPGEHAKVNELERHLIRDGREPEHASDSTLTGDSREVFFLGELWLLSAIYFLANYGWYFNITYLPSYLKDHFSASDTDVWMALYKGGPLWIGAIGCLVGGRLAEIVGRWSDRPRYWRRILNAIALAGSGAFWLAAIFATSATMFFLCASAAAFCTDLTLGSTWATCQEIGGRFPAVATAVMNTVGTLGAAAAGWGTGWLLEASREVSPPPSPSWAQIISLEAGYPSAFLTYFAAYLLASAGWVVLARLVRDEQEIWR
ncbi:MFS transporter [bacterium]|nr:MFS transporter [bacterium]